MSNVNGWQGAENAGDLDVTNPPSDFTAITATMDAQLVEEIARLRTALANLRSDHDMLTLKYDHERAENAALQADAALGRAVNGMQERSSLHRHSPFPDGGRINGRTWVYETGPEISNLHFGATASEALTKEAQS